MRSRSVARFVGPIVIALAALPWSAYAQDEGAPGLPPEAADDDDDDDDDDDIVRAPSLPPVEEEVEDAIVEEAEPEPELTPEERIVDLEEKLIDLQQRLDNMQENQREAIKVSLHGYVDFGYFVPRNNGVGWIQDFGNQAVPRFAGQYGWVFLGDILSTTINTRGEAADLGDAPGSSDRFDSVSSGGAPGFIVNEVNLQVEADLGYGLMVNSGFNVVPRTGNDFALGDFIELDIAELEWVVPALHGTSFFVGKVEPVIGVEYKDRKANRRFGITPSLVQRYNSGTQLGLKVRSKLLNDWIIIAAALTNGSSTTEQFHFFNEIDTNSGKTLSGRLAFRIPVGELIAALAGDTLEVGFSGEWGPQDRARDNAGDLWFLSVDLEYKRANFALKGQWIRGEAPGRTIDDAWELDLKDSGYVELNWMFLPYLGALLRGGLRNAFVGLGDTRAYLTKSWRLTVGARAVLGRHVVLKAEYLKNGEFGEVPEFQNDVFTSSLVLHY